MEKVSHCVLSLPLPRGALKFIWTPYSCDIIFKLFSLTYRPRIVYKVELPVFSILIIAKCLCGTLQLLPISVFSRVVMVGFKLPVGVVSTSVWLLVAFLSHVHCLWSSPTKFYTIICQNKMSTWHTSTFVVVTKNLLILTEFTTRSLIQENIILYIQC